MAKRKTIEQLIKENQTNAEFLFQLKIEKAIKDAYAQGYSDAVKALTNKVK